MNRGNDRALKLTAQLITSLPPACEDVPFLPDIENDASKVIKQCKVTLVESQLLQNLKNKKTNVEKKKNDVELVSDQCLKYDLTMSEDIAIVLYEEYVKITRT